MGPGTPRFINLYKWPTCQTVSKALRKLKNTVVVFLLKSLPVMVSGSRYNWKSVQRAAEMLSRSLERMILPATLGKFEMRLLKRYLRGRVGVIHHYYCWISRAGRQSLLSMPGSLRNPGQGPYPFSYLRPHGSTRALSPPEHPLQMVNTDLRVPLRRRNSSVGTPECRNSANGPFCERSHYSPQGSVLRRKRTDTTEPLTFAVLS